MTWNELLNHITLLPPSLLDQEILLIDKANECGLGIYDLCIPNETIYVTYNDGIMKDSYMEGWLEEEIEAIKETTYLTIEEGTPYLTAY